MARFIKYLLLLLILFTLTTCVVPYDVPVSQLVSDYAVSGLITDNPGPYSVSITYSAAYAKDVEGYNIPVEGATVTVTDTDSDVTTALTYQKTGAYVTDSTFRGIPGHHYVLHVLTADGDELISDPALLPPMKSQVTVQHQYVPESGLNPEGDKIWITVKDDPDQTNFYRWKYEGVFEFSTSITTVAPIIVTTCWQYDYSNSILLLGSDNLVNGKTFDQDITVAPYVSSTPYLITVYTMSLSQDAYNFWNLVQKQVNNTGGVFDSPPSDIPGNLHCVNDPQKEVLGLFWASSEIESHDFITHNSDPPPKNPRAYEGIPCNSYSNTVFETCCPINYPDGWPH